MKNRAILFVILMALSTSGIFASGWQLQGGIKSFALTDASPSRVVAKQLDGRFLLYCGDSVLYVNLASGTIDSTKQLFHNDTIWGYAYDNVGRTITSDGLSYCDFYNVKDGYMLTSDVKVYDISTGSLILLTSLGDVQVEGSTSGYINGFADYHSIIAKGIGYSNKSYYSDHGEFVKGTTTGYLCLLNGSGQGSGIASADICNLVYRDNFSMAIYRTYYNDYSRDVYNGDQTGTTSESLELKDLTNNKTYSIGYYNVNNGAITGVEPPSTFALANNINSFLTIVGQTLTFWSFDSTAVVKKDSTTIPTNLNWIKYSLDDRFIICAYNNRLIIYLRSNPNVYETFSVSANSYDLSSDGKGILCLNTSTATVNLIQPKLFNGDSLLARYDINKKFVYQKDTIRFTNYSQGNPDSVIWDFGDGTISNEINPIHSYNLSGVYSVKLTIVKGIYKDSFLLDSAIYVADSTINAIIEADTSNGVSPLTVNFKSDKTIGNFILNRKWEFNDGLNPFSTEINPSHVFLASGRYVIKLKIWNGIDTLSYVYPKNIVVERPKILSDSIFEMIDTADFGFKGGEAYRLASNELMYRISDGDTNKIIKYDNNYNATYKKNFLISTAHVFDNNLVRDQDGFFYLGAVDEQNQSKYCIYRLETKGVNNCIYSTSNINNGTTNCIRYTPESKGLSVIYKTDLDDQYNTNEFHYFHFDNLGDTICSGSVGYSNLHNNNIVKYFGDYRYGKKISASFGKYSEWNMHITQWEYHIIDTNCQNSRFAWDANTDNSFYYYNNTDFVDLAFLNYDSVIIRGANDFRFAKNSTYEVNSILQYSNIVNNISRFSDTSFIACGSKNNGLGECCWYAIIDIHGAILYEKFLDNYYGAFTFSNMEDNGQILLSGYLNYASGKSAGTGKGKIKNEKILSTVNNVVPYIVMDNSFKQNLNLNDTNASSTSSISVSPNPCFDKLHIDIKENANADNEIMIYDYTGKLIEKIKVMGRTNFDYDISALSSGFYYITTNIGGSIYSTKFIVNK